MLLAVDPGLSNSGYVVFNQYGQITTMGVLQTEKTKRKITRISDDCADRIATMSLALNQVIKDNNIKVVIGEMPIMGGQSSAAVRDMAIAVAISVSVFSLHSLPCGWCTPTEVKQALTGLKTASKQDMMQAACKKHSWNITTKTIYKKGTNQVQRIDNVYWPMGVQYGANKFEHIADAIGVAHALKTSNLIKQFIQRKPNAITP